VNTLRWVWQKILDWLAWDREEVMMPLERIWGNPTVAYHCGVSHAIGLCGGAYLAYALTTTSFIREYLKGYITALILGMVLLVFSRIFYGRIGVRAFNWGYWLGISWPPFLFIAISLLLEKEMAYDLVVSFTFLSAAFWGVSLFYYFLTRVRQTQVS